MEEAEQGTLLRNIILATARLLRGDDLSSSVPRALELVCGAVGAEAATIYEYAPSRHEATDDVSPEPSEVEAEPLFRWPQSKAPSNSSSGFLSNRAAPTPPRAGGAPADLAAVDPSPVSLSPPDPASADPLASTSSSSRAESTVPAGFSMTLPISVGDVPWGTLQLQTTHATPRWTRQRISVLQLMAQNFGEAIRRSRTHSGADASLPDVVSQVVRHAEASGQLRGGVAVVDPKGHVLYQNETLVDICGWTRVGLNRNGGLTPHIRPMGERGAIRTAFRDGTELHVDVTVGVVDAVQLHLHVTPVLDETDCPVCSVCWFQSAASNVSTLSNERQTLNLRRRVRAERALVDASKLLVSSDACDFDELLDIVGRATGARYAYLVIITPDDVVGFPQQGSFAEVTRQPIHLDTYRQYEWFASPGVVRDRDVEDDGGPTFAVPILSADDQLFGYLGVEYDIGSAPYRDEDARVLSVLGDMLCTYLRRQLSEEALRRSEQRYRYFVDTIDEAIWRIDLQQPIPPGVSTEQQVDHVLEYGVVSEANAALARLFGADAGSDVIGIPVSQFMTGVNRSFLHELADGGFELRQHEYVIHLEEGTARYFVVNTVGVDDGNGIEGIWGSGTEVTDRVVLERRMVEALERQQQRFGHDLHDRVSQQLAGTRMLAQNLSSRYFDNDPKGQREVDKIIDYVQEAAQHVSDLQRGVMPVQVDRDGLAQALRELTSRIERLPHVDCTYEHDGATDVSDHEVKLQLYRIAQEATRNALSHANPSHVHVELRGTDDAVVLRVSDDGIGFDLSNMEQETVSTLGLHSMRYRAQTIGARFQIVAPAGEGTTITVTMPRSTLQRRTA